MDKPSFQYVDGKVAEIKSDVGNLSGLPTTDKTSLVGAVSELFTSVSNGKSSVASAITDKGVQTASDATFAQMATNIRAISTGITPSGTININANGTYDVTDQASAVVSVPSDAPVDEAITITQNGTTNVPTGKRYNPICVQVAEKVKVWDVTITEDKSTDSVLVTDTWLATHYNDSGLAVLVVPKFAIPVATACSFGSFRANYTIAALDNASSWYGYYGYHTANSENAGITRLSDMLSDGNITGSKYGAIKLSSGGAVTMHCTSAYKIIAGQYRIIAWTVT